MEPLCEMRRGRTIRTLLEVEGNSSQGTLSLLAVDQRDPKKQIEKSVAEQLSTWEVLSASRLIVFDNSK